MTIRAAAAHDIPAVLALWAQARSSHADTPDTPESVRRLLATDPGALLVTHDLDGALIAGFDGWRGTMYRLAVAPSQRRRGIARALVQAGEERLKRLGAPKATALVGRGDTQAEALWAALGYDDDAGISRWVHRL